MSTDVTAIDVVEACYRLEGSHEEWLSRLVELSGRLLEAEIGTLGMVCKVPDDGSPIVPEYMVGIDSSGHRSPEVVEGAVKMMESVAPEFREQYHQTVLTPGLGSVSERAARARLDYQGLSSFQQ
ncbi:MAG: hypothetical protein R3324_17490, partial [Halobacteriales archaeon]|nr:hypothetical protein [Halobacteriales archaeon]